MEEWLSKILELGIGQGIWAVLYIYLFFRMLKENKSREDRYQSIIDKNQEIIGEMSGEIRGGINRIESKIDSIAGPNNHTRRE